jgi:hypothetical protein
MNIPKVSEWPIFHMHNPGLHYIQGLHWLQPCIWLKQVVAHKYPVLAVLFDDSASAHDESINLWILFTPRKHAEFRHLDIYNNCYENLISWILVQLIIMNASFGRDGSCVTASVTVGEGRALHCWIPTSASSCSSYYSCQWTHFSSLPWLFSDVCTCRISRRLFLMLRIKGNQATPVLGTWILKQLWFNQCFGDLINCFSYSVWKHIACNKLQLPEHLAWMWVE